MFGGRVTTCFDGARHDRRQPVGRHNEPLLIGGKSNVERSTARQQGVKALES
jgi:hypothetical protein